MPSFEAFLGRRYLTREFKRPKVLKIGIVMLIVGALGMWGASELKENTISIAQWWTGDKGLSDATYLLQYQLGQIAQIAQFVGLGLTVVSVSVTLFGFLNWWMTTFSAFSTFMIATGVAEVLLVLGVMNGFQGYLRSKLIDAHAHISVEPPADARWLSDYRALMAEVRREEGVLGVSPVLVTEVMLRTPNQDLSAAAQVIGIDTAHINETIKLDQFLKEGCGCLSALEHPEEVERYLSEVAVPTVGTFCKRSCSTHEETDSTESTSSDLDRLTSPFDKPDESAAMMPFPKPSRAPTRPSILLGLHLRYTLGLIPGARIDLISPLGDIGPNGPMPKLRPFTLAGWVSAGLVDVDAHQAYASLSSIQRYLGVPDVVSELRVRVERIEVAREIRDRLQARLGSRAVVRDWRERNQGLFSALQLERIAMFLVLTINILLAAFSITSTLVMTLIERRREIAILNAMGAQRRSVMQIFVYQGLTAGVIGSALGGLIGGGACLLISKMGLPLNAEEIYYISSIPVEVRLWDAVAIMSVALSVSLISTIYPAYYASKIKPVEGLKGR